MSPNAANHEAQMARWRSYLQDAPAPAFPRRQNLSVAPVPGALLRHKMALPHGVSVEISKALVQLAWCLVSVYYSDTDDIVVGLAVLNEDNSDSDTLSGEDSDGQSSAAATATALPFRFTMNPSQTIKSCIEDLILSHDLPELSYPSSDNLTLSEIAALGPDMSNATLFENQLVIYTPTSSPASYEVQLDRAVNIECTLSKSRATIQAFYDDSILPKAEMQGVLHTFEHVLTQLSTSYRANNTKTLGEISTISPKELNQVISWNKDLPPAIQDTKHAMITRQALATPDHEAICALNLSLSYSQLETLSNNLANHLIKTHHIKPGQIIPFMFEKSPWTIPTLLAILKSGAAFAPLDPTHSWTDTSGILSTCEASLVLCSPLHSQRFQSNNFPHQIITPSFLSSLPNLGTPPDIATPSSTAYVIFTSGSTGKPKGILCSHSAWVTHTISHSTPEFHTPETRILQFSAYTWDVSISDIFTTLATGGTICVPTEHERLNDLPSAFARMSANHIVVTPTVGQFLRPEQLPSLKTLVTIGEQMPQDFVTIWAGKVNLVNAYGPSETISRCCCSTKHPGDLAANIGSNVGAALWVTHSHDPTRLVPIGAIGELVVEGPILADGYLKNEAKTSEAFIPPPQWLKDAYGPDRLISPITNKEKVIYRTGDLVRQLQDGTYSYIGRRDTQIKVHGVRLEAGHIEAKIRPQLPHPDTDLVVDKIYVGKDETKLKQMLAAFITFPQFDLVDKERKFGVKLLKPELRVVEFCANLHRYLVGALPSYMVPNYILPVSMIPLGATGKVNRRGLQAFARGCSVEELNAFKADSGAVGGKERPRGEMEEKMAGLWASVIDLDVNSIGRDDSFFSLGGDSVSGMRLVSEAAKIGMPLSVADIFQFSVLHELAAFVAGTDGSERVDELEDIEPFELIGGPNKFRGLKDELKRAYKLSLRSIEDVYPATPMQEGMMAESIGSPEAYILQEVLRLSKEVDTDRLEEALQDMVDAYPILRTRIVRLKELGTCQVVMSEDSVPVELNTVDNTDLQSFLARDKSQHMGFGDVLSRFTVVHDILDGNRYFIWTAHHAITDGHMNEDIVRRLEIAYKKEEELPRTTEFNQFIKLQMENNSLQGSVEYWRQRFEGFDGNNGHFPPCEEEDYEPAVNETVTYTATLPREASKFTPSILLRAAWAYVLSQQASINGGTNNDSNDIGMGITQSGRHVSLPGVESCLGPCLVTIPVRVTLDMSTTVSAFLTQIQKEYIDAMPHQHTGLQHIRKASPECASAVSFRNLLVIQPANSPNNSNLFLTDESTITNADDNLNFGLFLECILPTNNTNTNKIQLRAGFDTNLLSSSEVTTMLHRLEHITAQLLKPSNSSLPLSNLNLVSPHDMSTLTKFNPDIPPYEETMHSLIESQARLRPNAPMIDSWDGQLSYRVANDYSDRLAGVLYDLGVRPSQEPIIPFAFEKSAYATIAIHAILKAGGAVVALDMSHPKDRHETVLSDTKARIIITSPKYTSQITTLLKNTANSKVVTISASILQSLPQRPKSTRPTKVSPSNPAWIVYSSGSTGKPKGTILEHRSLCSTSRTNSQILSVGPTTRAIHFASYSFDVAIEENTIIPMYGGCICIPSDEERLNDLPGAMRRMRVNWADLTPTVARMLTPENVPHLKTLVLGGESLTQDIIDTWATECDVFNTYGPSECSIQCTSSLQPLRSRQARGANIGSPVNCKLWIVAAEDASRLLPPGMTGELLIEGPIVGRGYLKRPEKTREVFIDCLPWAGDDKRRFYRTGDLARFNSDGTLDCLGRRDSQIKLNGQRVELGEIEYNIKKALDVGVGMGGLGAADQIAVEAFTPSTSGTNINGRKLLAAFVQFGGGALEKEKKTEVVTLQMTEDMRLGLLHVKTEMARHVPEYMVPSVWVPLVNMPMNTSGKIDRKKLREEAGGWDRNVLGGYSLAKEIVSVSPTAVRGRVVAEAEKEEEKIVSVSVPVKEESLEETLMRLWADVLGLDLATDPIDEDDSFLELGGDSIAAMHLVGKAKAAGLAGLSVPTIMKRPTFGGMVAAVAAKTPKRTVAPTVVSAPLQTPVPTPVHAPVVKEESLETTLARLWADVLGLDLATGPIGEEDSFLELGGDSIAAMHLVGKAKTAGLVGLSVPTIMKRPTFGGMVAAVASKTPKRAGVTVSTPVVKRVEVVEEVKIPVEDMEPIEEPVEVVQVAEVREPEPESLSATETILAADEPEPEPEPVAPVVVEEVMSVPTIIEPKQEVDLNSPYSPFQLVEGRVSVPEIMGILSANYSLEVSKVADVYPATPLQEGLMALTSADGNSYVLRDTYELPANIDVARFKAAWNTVARENAIFRTRILFIQGLGTCQVVMNDEPAIEWKSANNLDTYLANDREEPMNYGTKLARFAIVDDVKTKTFVWTIHHALYDGFSMGLTFAAVDHAYKNSLAVLPSRPFVDFIRCLQSIDTTESDNFWSNQLKDVEAPQFPLLPNGHVSKGDNSMTYTIPFSVDRSSGVTIATILKAAWAILVSRVSDSPDVVYGVTQFGRDLELDDIETINGPTITTVPVRITVDGKASVREFLKRVQTQAIDMIPFSHAGLQNIKKISDATRAASDFQNLLVIQPVEGEEESELFKKHTAATSADYLSGCALVVECALGDGEVVFSAHHDSSVISAPQVERLLHQFEHLLNQLQMVTGRIQDIDMFSPADRADLIAWNSNYPKVANECVHDVISRYAVTTPDAPAIASRAVNLNYKELDEYTNHLAHDLQALGVGPEKMVPICVEKSPEAIISMIAIQKAGGAYVPLNPGDPNDRLLDLLDQVSARVVIFSEQTKHLIPSMIPDSTKIHAHVLPPSLSAWPSPLNSHPVPATATPTNLAYALFTSGSTGRPKAVLVDHLTLCSSIQGHGPILGYADYPRRVLQFASYTFDACIAETFTALCFGACVCIPTEHERMNDLVKFMNDFQVNWAEFTPSFVRSLKPQDLPYLKTLGLGGEAMNQECIQTWGDKVHLLNGYGPTETCVITTVGVILGPKKTEQLERKLHRPRTETWIGHPVSSIGWVVDPKDHNRLTPVGCVGELLIQGPNVARGYLNNTEKTAEVFVSSPKWLRAFGHTRQEMLYKTGDLVVQDVVDGSFTYLGRKDNQTKVNGQRLELGEIETQLKAKGASVKVESAVVLPGKTKYEKTKQSLAAFILFSDIRADTKNIIMKIDDKLLNRLQRLESAMRATLPKYMVPTLWIPVSKMPALTSAKTDRKTLTALFKDLDTAQVTMYSLTSPDEQVGVKQVATTDVEKKLVKLIAATLGRNVDDIGTNDSFFRLGGDSITAIQLVAAARAENITLSTELIFRHPKIIDMAAAASSSSGADESTIASGPIEPFSILPSNTTADELMSQISAEYSIPSSSISDILPTTPLQEGLITLTLKDPSSYILREIYRLPSKIDLPRFKAAWEHIVSQQAPILRTRIVNLPNHGGSYQVVTSDKIAWIKAGKLQEYIDADKSRRFEYGTPLARFGLVETQYNGVYFVLTMHHSVYDGWSRALMFNLVGEAYRSSSSQLVAPVSGFNNFIAYLSTVSPSSAREFWTSQFNGLEGATAFPRIPASLNSAEFSPMLDAHVNLTIPLTPNSSSAGITISTLLKATYAIVLSRYTSSTDTLFGLVQSGRNVPIEGISDIVGPTITTVPLRISVNPEQPVVEYLSTIQSQSTDMIPFEHTGLQNIARFGTPGCRDAVNFGTIMVIQPAQDPDSADSEFLSASNRIEEDAGQGAQLAYGIGLEISLGKEKIELEGGYDSRLMSERSMTRLLRQFRCVFTELVSHTTDDSKTVGQINMVSQEDHTEMITRNLSSPPQDIQLLVHDVIHAVCLERSTAMAVNAWDVDFTYSEVDQLSTKLAKYLRDELAVGPETIVPLCFEKSGWAVIAILGVIKAGGAFVFLDPGYPMARLDEIVRQVQGKVILASLDQARLWKSAAIPVLVVDNVSIESLPSENCTYELVTANTGVTPNNSLYLIFTSGSTGTPKGCVIEHHSFLVCAKEQVERLDMGYSTRVLQGASYSFDVSVMEILTTLTAGACICVPNERIKKRSVVDVINDFGITWAFLTPSIVKFISPSDVSSLETLILGGEALSPQNLDTWAGLDSGVKLINGYGPSECTIAASVHVVQSRTDDPGNIGYALGGICWIVDAEDWNRLAPLGTVGELLIEGFTVARGYLNNEVKTMEVFVEDPVWAVEQDAERGITGDGERKVRRMYRTGDLAWFNEDGDIIFVGRKDAQVKVRGQRMELGEIETHLTLNKNIQHAVVAYPASGPCKKQLVGIVSLTKLGASTNNDNEVVLLDEDGDGEVMGLATGEVADISRKLAAVVPGYMIPEVWIVVQSFPLLLSGKLNRKRVEGWLSSMDKKTHQRIVGMGESMRVQAPSSDIEKRIHGVWVEVLKMPGEEIGVTQEFSTLGGDSILAMLVVGKLKALGFKTVTMTDVANAKTISQLAARIDRTTKGGNRNSIIQLGPPAGPEMVEEEEKIGELFDLSPIQQFYAGVALGGDYLSKQTNKRFNHTFCLTVRRPLPASTIKSALEALVSRHSMLRARFQPDESAECGWKQYISSDVSGSLRFVSWDDISLEQVKPVVEQARLGLDIENGPLVSVDLVTTPAAKEQYMMICAHHLVVDLVSWNIILSDLESYVRTGAFVSEPPTPFSTWLKHQQSYAAANFSPEKVFPLRSLPRPNFDYWDMAPSSKVNIVRDEVTHMITLSEKDTTTLLTTTNKLHGAEPMDILVSTLSHAFSYVFRDRPTPTIFRYGHGREQLSSRGPDPSGTVGWFTTFSPLHVSVRGRDGSLSVLSRTIDMRRKLPHNGLAYFASRYFNASGRKVFGGRGENQRSGHNLDLMEVTINYLGNSDSQQRGGKLDGEEGPMFDMSTAVENGLGNEGQEVKEFSLFGITAEVRSGKLVVICQWNSKMRRQDGIRRLWFEYENALRDVAYQVRKGLRGGTAAGAGASAGTGLRVPGGVPPSVSTGAAGSGSGTTIIAPPERSNRRPSISVTAPTDGVDVGNGMDRERLPSFSFSDYGDGTGSSFESQMGQLGVGITVGGGDR